jgi:hypothetical protein
MTGGAGLISSIGGGGGTGEVVVSTITQDNSFQKGNAVYNNNGVWKLAQANDADTLATHLITNVTSTTFDIVSIGKVEWTSHGLGTAGQILYTSETISGGLTTTEPGTYSNPVGFIFDENNIFIIPWRASATMGTSMTFNNMCRMHSGVVTITGGGGDVTVNLPFSWEHGFLKIYKSDVSNIFVDAYTSNKYPWLEISYDALISSGYSNQSGVSALWSNQTYMNSLDKTGNLRGNPKSATTTSFTLDDDGTTCYIKYFVWAPYSQTITFGSNEVITTSGSGAPTSTPVNIGDVYIDTTAKREYKAYGTSSSADWLKVPVYYSGTVTVTGGGGDVTVTLPWDWTNGYLNYVISDETVEYIDATGGNPICQFDTSYIALTGSYTAGHLINHRGNNAGGHYVEAKTADGRAYAKSATSTTIVFNDGAAGATIYVKYFVWA